MSQVHILGNPEQVYKKRIAIYCRVSTDRATQEESIRGQKDHFLKEIPRHSDWLLVDIYYEKGLSGTGKEKRPELQRLLTDCRKGKIDTVLTKSVSRFSRNTRDCLEMTRALTALGVNVIFEKEHLDTASMEGELFLTMLSSMAQEESRSISDNCRWAVRKRFQDGTFKLSRAPYGYRLVEGTPVPEPAEAAVVKRMFQAVIEGTGTTTLARLLNDEEVATKRGGRWHASTIMHILSNEIYIGDLRMQKTCRGPDYKAHVNHGEADQFYIRNHVETVCLLTHNS